MITFLRQADGPSLVLGDKIMRSQLEQFTYYEMLVEKNKAEPDSHNRREHIDVVSKHFSDNCHRLGTNGYGVPQIEKTAAEQ